jgi:membrane fusion protein, multidrug efflux system
MNQDDLPPPSHQPHAWEEEPRPMRARGRALSWVIGLLVLVALAGFAYWLSHHDQQGAGGQGGGGRHRGGGGRGGPPGMNQPTTVGTAQAVAADLPVQVEALGNVTPAATVTVRPQVSGTITQILFSEGQMVKRGQTLAVIDPRPYQATLLQAKGNLLRDQAQLENAKLQLSRYDTLIKQDSIARQDRDTQAATVHQLEGTVMADRGSVQSAEVNLGFTRIVSPVNGRIGLRVVDLGNYIGAGDTNGIAVVTTLQPIDVQFAVPQQQVPAIAKRQASGAEIPAIALDSTRTQTLDTGRFSTLDNKVDTTTGTVKGKARFPNPGNALYPSQFVNVRLTVDEVKNAVAVPPSAIRSGPDGGFVWILKSDRTVTQRKVKTGVQAGDKVQVTEGLKIGETIVTDGGDRLTEGTKVALPGDKPAQGGQGGGRRHRRG